MPKTPIPRNLVFTSRYNPDDPERDDIDIEAEESYRAETAPLVRFESGLLEMTNDYYKAVGRSPHGKARCALQWLDIWAENEALLGTANGTGKLVRQWTLASVSSAYAQIRDESSLDAGQKKAVSAWLEKLARTVMADYPDNAVQGRQQNNLMYWAAWSVSVTGIALDDRALYEWGITRALNAVQQIQPDGTLPLELARGKRALLYHQFALTPLLMLAETASHNGSDLYAVNNNRLKKLAARVLIGLDDSRFFVRKTGAAQDGVDKISPGHLAWMEIYNTRFPNSRVRQWLRENRPLVSRRLGGNMTQLYAR